MDDRRFDLLVKSIAASTSRRRLLHGLLGVAATAAGVTGLRGERANAARRGFSGPTFPTPLPTPSPTPTPLPCGANQTRCGTACVDTMIDPANCGGCGVACGPGGSCQAGSCTACYPESSGCNQGADCCSGFCMQYGASGSYCETCAFTLCSGFDCRNTDMDDDNCGGCGAACAPGLHCWNGTCQQCYPEYISGCAVNVDCCDPSLYCQQNSSLSSCVACMGTICGDSLCVDTTSDAQHCGSCDAPCAPGGYCYQGQCTTCTPPDYGCSGNSECCSGYCETYGASGSACGTCNGTVCGESLCVDLNSNQAHCGSCGFACTGGATCQFGICIGGAEA